MVNAENDIASEEELIAQTRESIQQELNAHELRVSNARSLLESKNKQLDDMWRENEMRRKDDSDYLEMEKLKIKADYDK